MNKNVTLAFVLMLASCANCHKQAPAPVQEAEPIPVFCEEEPVMEVNPCACVNAPAPYREIKHPRVFEEKVIGAQKRSCDDHQYLDCGCGKCDTFQPEPFGDHLRPAKPAVEVITYIPAQPEAYRLASNRAFNRFIKDTYDIYVKNPNIKVYVKDGVAKDKDMPQGIDKGVEAFKTNLSNSHTFVLVDDESKADYILDTTAEWFDTPSKEVPAIRYVVRLKTPNGNDAGAWSQIVRRADNKNWL